METKHPITADSLVGVGEEVVMACLAALVTGWWGYGGGIWELIAGKAMPGVLEALICVRAQGLCHYQPRCDSGQQSPTLVAVVLARQYVRQTELRVFEDEVRSKAPKAR